MFWSLKEVCSVLCGTGGGVLACLPPDGDNICVCVCPVVVLCLRFEVLIHQEELAGRYRWHLAHL